MPKTYYLDDNFINAALRNTPYTSPATIYVALYTVAPTEAGGGTEVSGGGYGRQTITFSVPVNGQSSNTADITFPVATVAWGTVTSFALLDAASGGNMLYFGNLSTPRNVLASDQIRFPAGQLLVLEQ